MAGGVLQTGKGRRAPADAPARQQPGPKRARPTPSTFHPSPTLTKARPPHPPPKKRNTPPHQPAPASLLPSPSPATPSPPSSRPQSAPRRQPSTPRPLLHNTYVPLTPNGHSLAFSSTLPSHLQPDALYQWLIAPLSTVSFYSNFFEKRPFALLRSHAAASGSVKLVTTSNTLPGILKARLASPPPASSAAASQAKVDQIEEDIPTTPSPPSSSSPSSPSPAHYYSGWFSKADVFTLAASTPPLRFTTDVDVTQYVDGKRLTLNPPSTPPVTLPLLRRFLSQGCSIRFLSPQQHHPPLHRLLHLLDDALGMQVGANAYLTPAGTQGFSPHFDDVDVWIMQTEGRKRWRLYEPMQQADILPLHSSRNFVQEELGRCVMDVWLAAGDCLYAPRGTVHQCVASEEEDSLHVTVSSCLSSSWGDYLHALLSKAVERAKASDAVFRRVMPQHFHRFMGQQHRDVGDADAREAFKDHALKLIERLITKEGEDDDLPYDDAADDMALDYMHARIQPHILPAQQSRSCTGNPSFVVQPSTLVRLLERDVLRLTPSPEAGSVRVHHIVDNAKGYKGAPLGSIDVDEALASAVEAMVSEYPRWCRVAELPFGLDEEEGEGEGEEEEQRLDDDVRAQELVHLCQALYDSGLIEATDEEEHDGEQEDDTAADNGDSTTDTANGQQEEDGEDDQAEQLPLVDDD